MPISLYKLKELENVAKSCYNKIRMNYEKLFNAEYTSEALEQFQALDIGNQDKILSAVKSFEILGKKYKNINDLGDDLFEIKPKGVRAYFQYDKDRKRIIIIGFITLKKTQKAPKRYIKQAIANIRKYKELLNEQNNKR